MLELGSVKVWIDFLPYANRLFAAGRKDLWSNADTFISVFSQGQGLLRSDVLSIPLHPFYMEHLDRETSLIQGWMGKRPTFALKKLLSLSEPQKIVSDILSGFQNLYQGAKPVVLLLPSPQGWLQWLQELVRPGQALSLEEDDIEAASMYLAEYVRGLSSYGLSAIILEENSQPIVSLDKALPLYRPVLNLAKHYQWSTGVLLESLGEESLQSNGEIDLILCKTDELTALTSVWEKGWKIGGGLTRHFWSGQCTQPDFSQAVLFYGQVPEDAEPETVLSQLKWLQ